MELTSEVLCLEDSISHCKYLSTELLQQKMVGEFCDVSLKILGHSVAVHSCVLAAFCQSQDSNSCQNRKQKPMELIELDIGDDITDPTKHSLYCDALNKIVDFVYTGKLDVNAKNALIVKRVAEKIQLKKVVDYCDNLICACDNELMRIPKRKKRLRLKKKGVKKSRNFNNIENESIKTSFDTTIVNFSTAVTELDNEPEPISITDVRNLIPNSVDDIPSFGSVIDESISAHEKTDNIIAPNTSHIVVTRRSLSCGRCPYVARTALQLRKHEHTHAGGKWYACCSCGFLAIKVNRLLNHLREQQHNETVCSLCSFEAGSSVDLQKHLRRHEHSKPFFCWSCDRRFSTRTALNLHLPKHSNQKPFECPLCSRGFKWKHALQSHMLVHTQEKQHLCDQCGYRTAHQSSFKAHCLLHTGATFKCSQTGCAFEAVRKQNLQQHLRTHLKEKPFQCEVCGRAFSLVKNLRRHARMHNAAETLLRCPDCGFTSTRIDKVKEHARKHHKPVATWDPAPTSSLPPLSPHNDDDNNNNDDEVPIVADDCSVATFSTFFPNLHMVVDGETLTPVSDVLTLNSESLGLQSATSSLPITLHSVQDVDGQQIVTYSTLPMTQVLPMLTLQASSDPNIKDS